MKTTKIAIITLIALTAIAIVAATQTTHTQTTPTHENAETWQKWVQAYKIITELSQTGINTTQYTQKLKQALQAIQNNDYGKAEDIINQIMPELQQLQANMGNYALIHNTTKYLTVAIILSIAPITYYTLPRAYLSVWYRIKRKWKAASALR